MKKLLLGGDLVETWDISATENDNVIASLYSDEANEGYYILVISGSGNMKDWTASSSAPWYSLYRESIKSLRIDSVTSIGSYAFCSCDSLTSVSIGDSVTSIGSYAFCSCDSLTSVSIGNSLTSIGKWAFGDCSSLTSVVIGNSVTSIGNYAFYSCDSLMSIKYRGTEAQWNAISKGFDWDYGTGGYTITYNYKGD